MFKKKIALIITLLCCSFALIFATGCTKENESGKEQDGSNNTSIPAPEILANEQGIFWTSVNNAVKYKYQINGEEWIEVDKNTLSIKFPTIEGSYSFRLVSIGKDDILSKEADYQFFVKSFDSSCEIYANSLQFTGNNIWYSVNSGDYYKLNDNNLDFSSCTIGETYNVSYYTKGANTWDLFNKTYYIDGMEKSVSLTVRNALTMPVLELNSAKNGIKWEKDINAISYTVISDGVISVANADSCAVNFLTTAGNHIIKVKANENGSYTYSDETVFEYSVENIGVPAITYNQVENKIVWDEKLTDYMLSSSDKTVFNPINSNCIDATAGITIKQNDYFDEDNNVWYINSKTLSIGKRQAPLMSFDKNGKVSWNNTDSSDAMCYYAKLSTMENFSRVNINEYQISDLEADEYTLSVYCDKYIEVNDDSAILYLPSATSSISFSVLPAPDITIDPDESKLFWETNGNATDYEYRTNSTEWTTVTTNGELSIEENVEYFVRAVGDNDARVANSTYVCKSFNFDLYPITIRNSNLDFTKLTTIRKGCYTDSNAKLITTEGADGNTNQVLYMSYNLNRQGVGFKFDDIQLKAGTTVFVRYKLVVDESVIPYTEDLDSNPNSFAFYYNGFNADGQFINYAVNNKWTEFEFVLNKDITLSSLCISDWNSKDYKVDAYFEKLIIKKNGKIKADNMEIDFNDVNSIPDYLITADAELTTCDNNKVIKMPFFTYAEYGVYNGVGFNFDSIPLTTGYEITLTYKIDSSETSIYGIYLNGPNNSGSYISNAIVGKFVTLTYKITSDKTLNSIYFSHWKNDVYTVVYIKEIKIKIPEKIEKSIDFSKVNEVPYGNVISTSLVSNLNYEISTYKTQSSLKLSYDAVNSGDYGCVGFAFNDITMKVNDVLEIEYAMIKGATGCFDLNGPHNVGKYLTDTVVGTDFVKYSYTFSKETTLSSLYFSFYSSSVSVEIYVKSIKILHSQSIESETVDFGELNDVPFGYVKSVNFVNNLNYEIAMLNEESALKLTYSSQNIGTYGCVGIIFNNIALNKGDVVKIKYAIVKGASGSIEFNGPHNVGKYITDTTVTSGFKTLTYPLTTDLTLSSIYWGFYSNVADAEIYVKSIEIIRYAPITADGIVFADLTKIPYGMVTVNSATPISELITVKGSDGTDTQVLHLVSNGAAYDSAWNHSQINFASLQLNEGDQVKITYKINKSSTNAGLCYNGDNWIKQAVAGEWTTYTYTAPAGGKTLTDISIWNYENNANVSIDWCIEKVEIVIS